MFKFGDQLYGPCIEPVRVSDKERFLVPQSRQKLDEISGPKLKELLDHVLEEDGLYLLKVIFRVLPILWVVDCKNDFYFAIEEVVNSETGQLQFPLSMNLELPVDVEKLGHPSLANGGPARLGGELLYDPLYHNWMLTNHSGRFGAGPETKIHHLKNVAKLLQKYDINVDIRFREPKIRRERYDLL